MVLRNCTKNPEPGPTAWRVLEEPNGSYYLRVCFSHPSTIQPTIAPDGAPKEESEYAAHQVTYGCYKSDLTAFVPRPLANAAQHIRGSARVAPARPDLGPPRAPPRTPVWRALKRALTLPSAKQCLSARLIKIHLAEPKYDPFKTVSVTLKGRKIATVHKGRYVVATIDLKGLPKGAITVKITVTTVLKHHLSASRTYHTCTSKIKPQKTKKK